jgi:D-serine deaminase-like pyridoxal phosphate-dependent protein
MMTMRLEDLDTPALVVDADRLERNLRHVQQTVEGAGKNLRPHIKAHKIPDVARRQLELGAVGLTTAKLAEAEAMAAAGLDELFVCYPLVGRPKIERLLRLARERNVMTVVDGVAGADALGAAFAGEERPLGVLVKVDAGFGRVGARAADAIELCRRVAGTDGLDFRGVCIHEGSTYAEPDTERRNQLAAAQARELVAIAEQVRALGIRVDIVSAGSTPGLAGCLDVEGLTEVRPGNYAFYDAIQVGLGVAQPDECALTVLTTVVSTARPTGAVCDAGSKALALDRGAHGLDITPGHGTIIGRDGLGIQRLSEEHGWLADETGAGCAVGDVLRVIPNHACAVVNNFDHAWVAEGDEVVDRWPITARGAVT